MSAYIVDRNHIIYLVTAAMHRSLGRKGDHVFRYYHAGKWHAVNEHVVETAQMLWNENVKSVRYRYSSGDLPGPIGDLPGPIGEDYKIRLSDFPTFAEPFDAAQVLQSIACLDYQSCEHPEWKDSAAYAFLEALKDAAVRAIPGYDDAKWGAPDLALWAPAMAARRLARASN